MDGCFISYNIGVITVLTRKQALKHNQHLSMSISVTGFSPSPPLAAPDRLTTGPHPL